MVNKLVGNELGQGFFVFEEVRVVSKVHRKMLEMWVVFQKKSYELVQ
jgi:hypothetical protein